MENNELYEIARNKAKSYSTNKKTRIARVAVALLANNKKIYTGISVETSYSLGICAEYNAIANMLQDKESKILKIIAVNDEGKIYSPCGRCREYIYQINYDNMDTEVILENKTLKIKELLPEI